VNSTTLNQNLGSNLPGDQTRIQIEVENVELSQGDTIRIEGRAEGIEFTSFDKITFTPQGGQPPQTDVEIISNGGDDVATINLIEGATVVTDVDIYIGDSNVSYRINAGPDRDLFNINEQTGVISFVDAPDFEAPGDADSNNTYQINVLAVGANSTDSQFISVVVGNDASDDPQDLQIISNDIGAAGNGSTTIRVGEGRLSVTDVNVAGSEENVTYRFNAGDDVDLFSINRNTGAISFNQRPDFENPLDANANNVYQVNVLATRGNQSDRQFINIIVENEVEPQTAPVSVYLLAGQSNLVGAALVENLSDPSFAQPFAEAQIWSRPNKNYVDLQPSFDGRSDRVGTSLSFGRKVVENTGEEAYLVEYGLGGTSLAEDWNANSGEQFEQFRDVTVEALDNLVEQGLDYEVKGLVWYQGESDVFDDSFANSYQDNLLGFIDGIRDFYGENLDVAVGLIRSDIPTSLTGNIQTIREAQRAVSIGDANVFAVDTDLLGGSEAVRADNPIHLNADAQVTLGNRFADVFTL